MIRLGSNPQNKASWLYDLFSKLFADYPGGGPGLISWEHLLLLIIAFGMPVLFYFIYRNKSDEKKIKLTKVLSVVIPTLYVLDFFVQPFYMQTTKNFNGEFFMTVDKLPFHVCTLMGVCIPFVYFNKKFAWARDIVVVWSIVSAAIYCVYPGTYLNDAPIYSYRIIQSYGYHALLILWAMMMFMTRQVEFDYKKFWKPIAFMGVECLWASLGNAMYYDKENFFFMKSDPAWFGLGFLNTLGVSWLIYPIMIIAMSSLVALIYLLFGKINKIRDVKGSRMAIKGETVSDKREEVNISSHPQKETA